MLEMISRSTVNDFFSKPLVVVENLLVKNHSSETLKHAHARFRGYITTKMFDERMLLKLIYLV